MNDKDPHSELNVSSIQPQNLSRIATARLVLRAPRSKDAGALAAMMTPSVSRGLGAWPVPFTIAMAADRIEVSRRAEADGVGLPRVIECAADGMPLGWIGLSRTDALARRATLGYWLGEAHQRQGLMREAAPAMIALAFRNWDVDMIEATTHPDNLASAAVLDACGMRPRGERTIFAPARQREELCLVFSIARFGTRAAQP